MGTSPCHSTQGTHALEREVKHDFLLPYTGGCNALWLSRNLEAVPLGLNSDSVVFELYIPE